MTEEAQPNYPDILGYISDGERFTVSGIVDVAIAVRPQTINAGRPFSVIAVVQNLTDVSIQVFGVIQLPQKDLNKHDEPFMATADTMEHVLYPAEVGYMIFPVNSRMTAAVGDYRLSVEFYVRRKGKPRLVRDPEGTSSLEYYFYLSESTIARMAKLKQLAFSGAKRGLLGSKSLDTPFHLEPGNDWKGTRKKPAWVSLWTMGEHTDGRALLERHGRTVMRDVFPQLTTKALYRPLGSMIQARIRASGYDLSDTETHYITKLMICILEMANETLGHPAFPEEDIYRVAKNLNRPWPVDGTPVPLPRWCRVMLEHVDYDERFIQHPIDALAGPLFSDLLYDAIEYGFNLMEAHTDVNLGTVYQIGDYATQIIDMLWDPEAIFDLVEVYIPLVLGGVLVDERVIIPNENKLDNLKRIFDILQANKSEDDPELMGIIEMGEDVIHLMLKKYGYRMGRY